MKSQDYRSIVSKIVKAIIRKKAPGLKKNVIDEISAEAAKNVHARMYGADVDGVASPIWRDHDRFKAEIGDMQPIKTAQELLDEKL